MGTFGITTARSRLGFTPSVTTPIQADVRGTGGDGALIGDALLAGAELYRKYEINQANVQLSQSQRQAEEEINQLEIRRLGNLDPDTYQADFTEAMQRIQSMSPKNKRGAKAYSLWLNSKVPRWQGGVYKDMIARSEDNWESELFQKIALVSQTGTQDSFDDANSFIDLKQAGPSPLDATIADKMRVKTKDAHVTGKISALSTLGYSDGNFEAFEEARKIARTEILDPTKSLDAVRGINLLEKQTKDKIEDIKYTRNLGIDQDFIGRIQNKTLFADDILKSKLDDRTSGDDQDMQISKTEWIEWVDGASGERPSETTPSAFGDGIDTVIKANQKTMGTIGAYREILDSTYAFNEMTDVDSQDMIRRIDTPYPLDVINNIETVVNSNRKAEKSVFKHQSFEKINAARVNKRLLDWIDDYNVANGKYPTAEEMNSQSAHFRGNPTQIIPTPEPKNEDVQSLSTEELLKRISN